MSKAVTKEQLADCLERIGDYFVQTNEDFTGASDSAAGAKGMVPAPSAGDDVKFLRGDGTWAEPAGGGGGGSQGGSGECGVRLADVTGVGYEALAGRVNITWTDPDDVSYQGASLARWTGTKLVRKVGSAPADETDGTVVVDSKTRNAYSTTAYVDRGITNGTTYYYRLFPYTDVGTHTAGTSFNATPNALPTTMTVTKTDDAIGDIGTTHEVATISTNSDGILQATSSDTSIGTVSITNNTLYVTVVQPGTITVTVWQLASEEYATATPIDIDIVVDEGYIVGICLVQTGGGSGTWARVDKNGNAMSGIDFNGTYPWSDIQPVTIDSQAMIYIPKFYIKTGTFSSGTYNGKRYWLVSSVQRHGFRIHPAFVRNGNIKNGFYIGQYLAYNSNGIAGSASGKSADTDVTLSTINSRISARNDGSTSGAKAGWHLLNVYEMAAIQLLCLIDIGTPNVQTAIGESGDSASWRNINKLWRNKWQHIAGLQTDSNGKFKIFKNDGTDTYVTTTVSWMSGWMVDVSNATGTDYNLNDVFLPSSTDSSENNATFSDYITCSSSKITCYWGGSTEGTLSQKGLFCLSVNYDGNNRAISIGYRIAKYDI